MKSEACILKFRLSSQEQSLDFAHVIPGRPFSKNGRPSLSFLSKTESPGKTKFSKHRSVSVENENGIKIESIDETCRLCYYVRHTCFLSSSPSKRHTGGE